MSTCAALNSTRRRYIAHRPCPVIRGQDHKSVTGPDVRTEYLETYAYINVGITSDSGTWKTEASTVCNEWKKLRPACSEIRALGVSLYVKRANNGEIMVLVPQ